MFVVRHLSAFCFAPRIEEFDAALRSWIAAAPPGEQREDAAGLIRECSARKLPRLTLVRMGLSSLPDCIAGFTHLESLWLNGNRLPEVPHQVTQLPHLQQLDLSENLIGRIALDLRQIKSLRKLWLDKNQLTALPDTLCELPHLIKLSVKDNELGALPEGFSALTSLEELSLSGNALTHLPTGLTALTNLRLLNLSNNRLASLPEDFALLERRIPSLDIRHNHLLPRPDPEWFAHPKHGAGFKKWFDWLHDIRDYKNPRTRIALGQRLGRLFEAMQGSRTLRDSCLAIAADAAGSCGDRPAWGLNQMDMALENHLAMRGKLNEADLFRSARSQYRLVELKRAAREHTEFFSYHIDRGLDEVEVDLALQTALRDVLHLPLTVRQMDGLGGTFFEPEHFAEVANRILDGERSNLAPARELIDSALQVLRDGGRLPVAASFKLQALAWSVSQYLPWQKHIARRHPEELQALQGAAQAFIQQLSRRNEAHYKEQCDAAMFLHNHGLAYDKALARMAAPVAPRRSDNSRHRDNRNDTRGTSSTVSKAPTTAQPSRPDNTNIA